MSAFLLRVQKLHHVDLELQIKVGIKHSKDLPSGGLFICFIDFEALLHRHSDDRRYIVILRRSRRIQSCPVACMGITEPKSWGFAPPSHVQLQEITGHDWDAAFTLYHP